MHHMIECAIGFLLQSGKEEACNISTIFWKISSYNTEYAYNTIEG